MLKRRALCLVLLCALCSALFAAQPAAALAQDYRYTSWDVDLTINKDSTIDVVETLTQEFDGDFTGSFRDIYYGDNILSFSDFMVSEGGTAYTVGSVYKGVENPPGLFSVTDYRYANDSVEVLYSFRASNETKSFVIKYTAEGGFYYYDKTDRVEWKAISEVREKPIDKVTVTAHMPEDVKFKKDYIGLRTDGKNQSMKQVNARTVKFSATDLGPNTEFLVGLEFPKGVVTVNQALLAKQQQIAARKVRERWAMIAVLGASVMLVVGVFLIMLLVWWKWGRDAELPPASDYLTEPPGTVPPAVVSELIFESTDTKDINATLVDLAGRGYLKFWKKPGDTLFQWLEDKGDMRPFEQQLIGDLFSGQPTAELSSWKNKFFRKIPILKKQISQEAVKMGFYKTPPSKVRSRFTAIGLIVPLVGGLISCCLMGPISDEYFADSAEWFGNMLVFSFPAALAICGVIILVFGYLMPRKTQEGAEAHARWWAFRNYLANIQKYGKTGNAQEIFEKYMPYAIAFGLEKVFTDAFTVQEVIPPFWYAPYWYPGYPNRDWADKTWAKEHPGEVMPTGDASGGPLGGFDLNEMSKSFTSTLNDVATTLTSQPSSSGSGGGGFSGGGGGGFSGGGGGGGGSGSW
jgi:hypothetical protein